MVFSGKGSRMEGHGQELVFSIMLKLLSYSKNKQQNRVAVSADEKQAL